MADGETIDYLIAVHNADKGRAQMLELAKSMDVSAQAADKLGTGAQRVDRSLRETGKTTETVSESLKRAGSSASELANKIEGAEHSSRKLFFLSRSLADAVSGRVFYAFEMFGNFLGGPWVAALTVAGVAAHLLEDTIGELGESAEDASEKFVKAGEANYKAFKLEQFKKDLGEWSEASKLAFGDFEAAAHKAAVAAKYFQMTGRSMIEDATSSIQFLGTQANRTVENEIAAALREHPGLKPPSGYRVDDVGEVHKIERAKNDEREKAFRELEEMRKDDARSQYEQLQYEYQISEETAKRKAAMVHGWIEAELKERDASFQEEVQQHRAEEEALRESLSNKLASLKTYEEKRAALARAGTGPALQTTISEADIDAMPAAEQAAARQKLEQQKAAIRKESVGEEIRLAKFKAAELHKLDVQQAADKKMIADAGIGAFNAITSASIASAAQAAASGENFGKVLIQSIGSVLVADGTKNLLEGIGRGISSYGLDPTAEALIAIGGTEITAGIGMGAASRGAGGSSSGSDRTTSYADNSRQPIVPNEPRLSEDQWARYNATGSQATTVINVNQPAVISPGPRDGQNVRKAQRAARLKGYA